MSSAWVVLAVLLVSAGTLIISAFGLRMARTTSDFYVAGRAVSPHWNAAAIGGEYLSAASFLGVAGLVFAYGPDMLWLPVGYTTGFLVLLVLVAAPLRRSGAYTLADFAQIRLGSRTLRLMVSAFVIGTGWLYLLPQFQAAGLTMQVLTGWPSWVGSLVVFVVVLASVLAGGMRSITLVQAVQYWIKLTALAVPAFILLFVWVRHGQPTPTGHVGGIAPEWLEIMSGYGGRAHPAYVTYSTLLALSLGTMGLPHILVRFYTNPDGRAARRTTTIVIALLGIFYVFTPVYAVLGRSYLPIIPAEVRPEFITLMLPSTMVPGLLGDVLTAILAAGAFAAFLSTASGLTISVAGVVDQDFLGPVLRRATRGDSSPIHGFRIAVVLACLAPYLVSLMLPASGVVDVVGMAFSLSAAAFCPLLILGVWWSRLTVQGAASGLVVGGGLTAVAALMTLAGLPADLGSWTKVLLAQPAAWAVPLSFVTMIVVSLATPGGIPRAAARTMARLHSPEETRQPPAR